MSLFSPTSGSSGAVEAREGISRGACERLNLHRTASAGPAASFNLRLSQIFPGPVEDFGRWRGGFREDDKIAEEEAKEQLEVILS